ncbi:MAG: alanine racemase [Calditrichota bacterium]
MEISAITTLRPTRAEIDLSALAHNLSVVKHLAGPAQVLAVVKAEAYGHGLTRIAQEFEKLGVDYLGVSFLEEGVALRQAGVNVPILVMGGLVDEQVDDYLEWNLTATVSSVWKARQINEAASRRQAQAIVHLKFDTGMGRIGQHWQTAHLLLNEAARLPHLRIEGIYSHLASADEQDLSFAYIQLERFQKILETAKNIRIDASLIHIANSGALMQLGAAARFTLVRPGLLLYGWTPSYHLEGQLNLQTVMTLKTRVVFVKKPPPESTIGYGSTWTSPGERWIATLPIGYGDGYPRRAGNRSQVFLRGRKCPIVGRVSMDQITVDAGPEAYLGDEVILFGGKGDSQLSLWDLCRTIDAVPYEILCGLTLRVPRVYDAC